MTYLNDDYKHCNRMIGGLRKLYVDWLHITINLTSVDFVLTLEKTSMSYWFYPIDINKCTWIMSKKPMIEIR